MTNLEIRRPPFQIDETVPFQWQPRNPAFGLFGNTFTFLAIAFERYIVAATRQAMDRLTDPSVAEEAEAFLRQEAQHAKAHRAHAQAMIAQHPGLGETFAKVNSAYDDLLDSETLEFHLAYIANLEATFTPLFRMVFDNRGPLFEGSDERVGTLLLWHFVEEIEHRSSALLIHHAVTPDPWFRIRKAPKTFRHVAGIYSMVLKGIDTHVGREACGISPKAVSPFGLYWSELGSRLPGSRDRRPVPSMLAHVPGKDLRTMMRHLALCVTPKHDPGVEPLPTWIEQWHATWSNDGDVTSYASVGL